MFDDAYITIPMIALYVGAKDPFNLTEEEFEAVADALRRLRPQVGTIARGFDDATTIYAAGDAVIGYCQNIAIVNDLNGMGKNFGYSFPTEGTPTWIDCSILTPRGERQEVYDFINANLTPRMAGAVHRGQLQQRRPDRRGRQGGRRSGGYPQEDQRARPGDRGLLGQDGRVPAAGGHRPAPAVVERLQGRHPLTSSLFRLV